MGKRASGLCAIIAFGLVLSAFAARAATRIVATHYTISAFLGHRGGWRFASVFGPDSPDSSAATGWHRTHYCGSHWFRHYSGQHPANRLFTNAITLVLHPGTVGFRPDARLVGAAPAGINYYQAAPAIPDPVTYTCRFPTQQKSRPKIGPAFLFKIYLRFIP